MIIIKENGRIYIAETTYITTKDGQKDVGCAEENMPMFKVPGSRTLIAGFGDRWHTDVDCIRYVRAAFPAKLSVPALHRILYKFEAAVDELGGLKDGNLQTDLVFAKGDTAFILVNGTAFKQVESLETVGPKSIEYRYAMMLYADLPVVDRIRAAYKMVGSYIGVNTFPVVLWDTKTLQPTLIEEDA